MSNESIWNYRYPICNGLTIKGHSRGGEMSGFYIPELKLMFDAGIRSKFSPRYIFITHCHTDHSFALPMIITGLSKMPLIYAPSETFEIFNDFLASAFSLSKGIRNISGRTKVNGILPCDEVKLNDKYIIKAYDLCHNVPTRGYGLILNKKRLKQEYKTLTQQELVSISKHTSISEYYKSHIFAYICDTNIMVFNQNPELLKYQTIMVECTFLGIQTNEPDITDSRHIHWGVLKEFVNKYSSIEFILIHFSMRYSIKELEDFSKEQKLMYKNIHFWLN
jgi:ribonuclease Z